MDSESNGGILGSIKDWTRQSALKATLAGGLWAAGAMGEQTNPSAEAALRTVRTQNQHTYQLDASRPSDTLTYTDAQGREQVIHLDNSADLAARLQAINEVAARSALRPEDIFQVEVKLDGRLGVTTTDQRYFEGTKYTLLKIMGHDTFAAIAQRLNVGDFIGAGRQLEQALGIDEKKRLVEQLDEVFSDTLDAATDAVDAAHRTQDVIDRANLRNVSEAWQSGKQVIDQVKTILDQSERALENVGQINNRAHQVAAELEATGEQFTNWRRNFPEAASALSGKKLPEIAPVRPEDFSVNLEKITRIELAGGNNIRLFDADGQSQIIDANYAPQL